ncbi:tetratricopeptide repeat protein [Prevotella melaninogenica]|uniref:tetratricopeptide repeat protein n=1 Tax=Prevotella melaninogenica TaxID=28132 RepID=UPI001C5DADC1|nr:tetratricopeptide repeat protein [Prevotella melaninogenica]MBW4901290.1 tetratricopeptide repeat protein [Prevotella melaninogenica]
MNVEEILSKAINCLMDRRLSNAIEVLEQLYVQRPSLMGHSEFDAIKTDYQLMVDYMGRGFSDSHRESLYSTLLQRLYRVAADLEISWRCKNVSAYVNSFRVIDHLNTSHDFVRTVLESFVSDIAMLSLQPEETREQKSTELYDRHQSFMNRLFSALWTSCQWTDDDCKFYTELLLSPTVMSTDQQLIVSAISLGAMNQFDINKFKTLVNVYQQATDEHVRQRALVGWVLAVFEGMDIFPEQDTLIRELCENPTITRELLTLQIQFFYSKDAEKDNDKIQRDIMPDIMRNSNLTIGRLGIMEKEEDAIESILHQDADEKRMEQMEEKVRKMMDMQKQGSDIYFGGFSQMKRFPFFNDMVNWFTPFYLNHPALRPVISKLGDTKFLNTLMERSNFCESDRYSFAFALEQIINQLPSDIKEVIGSDAMLGPLAESDDVEDAISIRRTYLQDLYRFFRLYHTANDFINPFEDNGKGDFVADTFFFTYKSFMGTGLDDVKLRLASHLYKHQQMTELAELLTTFQSADPRYAILMGYTNIHMGKAEFAYQFFDYALKAEPDNQWALKGKARAALDAEDYKTAEEVYTELLKLEPGHKNYTMNRCVALLKLGRTSEVREELFRLDYQYPEDMNVKRVLAWAMLSDNSLDKASQLYDTLLTSTPAHEDYLNAGYCQWAMGNVQRAVELFREWMVKSGKSTEQLLEEFRSDADTLEMYGISETDCFLMLSLVG